MSAIDTIHPSVSKAILDNQMVTKLGVILDTEFTDLDAFFASDNEKRVLKELLENHSSIVFTRDLADDEHPPTEPRLFFPALNMSLVVGQEENGWFQYKLIFNEADGKRLESGYDTEYPELTIQYINGELKGQRFVELHDGYMWFLVPNTVTIDELNELLGEPLNTGR